MQGHHTHWGSSEISPRGTSLYDATDEKGLFILNDKSPTRISENQEGPPTTSAIDVTVVSPNLKGEASWEVLNENLTSDHLVIVIKISRPPKSFPSRSTHRLNLKNIDWNDFRLNLDSKLVEEFDLSLENFSHLSVEEKYESKSHPHPIYWKEQLGV